MARKRGALASDDQTVVVGGYVAFKSRLHSEVQKRDRLAKDSANKDLEERKKKLDRLRSYSKNLK